MSREEMLARGWEELDVVLVSGDAYVDHPSYGVSVIGRLLESRGWRVGVIAQPDWRTPEGFTVLGRPRLFFGITAGSVDSMVANYSANHRPREEDDYSPGRRVGLRPDRAVIVYANRLREAFGPGVPIVIGGIEASLRRFAHYDYWDDRVRRSILLDSRAHLLVYGMGERQVVEIAERLGRGEPVESLDDIRGTALVRRAAVVEDSAGADALAFGPGRAVTRLPSCEEVRADPARFNEAFLRIREGQDPAAGLTLVQPHADQLVVVNPPALPLSSAELDGVHALPYTRSWHPRYDAEGGIRALETVRFSVTAHRGCCGECSFCAIAFHQGRIVQSRSPASILEEIRLLAGRAEFHGTVTDIGGPTANLYAASCERWKKNTFCRERSCLVPQPCPRLGLAYPDCIRLYRDAADVPGVKHVFIGSGLRYDLLVQPEAQPYLEQVCAHQISGLLKVAPEHRSDAVLRLMNKSAFAVYERFVERFKAAAAAVGRRIYIVNYFITAHPGTTPAEAFELARWLAERGIRPEQIQDFLPSPMTRSTAMYHTGLDPLTGKPVHVPRSPRERRQQRALAQYDQPRNRSLLVETLRELGRMEQLSLFTGQGGSGPAPHAGGGNHEGSEQGAPRPKAGAARPPAAGHRGHGRSAPRALGAIPFLPRPGTRRPLAVRPAAPGRGDAPGRTPLGRRTDPRRLPFRRLGALLRVPAGGAGGGGGPPETGRLRLPGGDPPLPGGIRR